MRAIHLVVLLIVFGFTASVGFADSRSGKLVVTLDPVDSVQVEMPDGSIADYGQEIQSVLTTAFTNSGRYIIASPAQPSAVTHAVTQAGSQPDIDHPDIEWSGSVTPSSEIHIHVDALSLTTGTGGESMFYGFNENFRTPFNDGTLSKRNEFPLKEVAFDPNWFDRNFDDQGDYPFDSQAGLDLGDGFTINLLFAYVSLKYATYHSTLHLSLNFDSAELGRQDQRSVQVSGKGFFYDFAGGYMQYSAGIEITREDAMAQAMKNAISGSFAAIDSTLANYPSLAKIDQILDDGTVLLGTGPASGVVEGTIYEPINDSSVAVKVVASNSSGSIAQVVQGNVSQLSTSMLLVQAGSGAHMNEMTQQQVEQVALPDQNFEQANLGNLQPSINWAQAAVDAAADTIAFAYRLSRYQSYDQDYHSSADQNDSFDGWIGAQAKSAWGAQMGLDKIQQTSQSADGPIVAVIDTGVDYNHPVIHPSIWKNPRAGAADPYGWDFVSQDARPYDDGYHGTWMAGAVLEVAPQAQIMAIKAINPFGVTSSAALYGAFQYAVDRGAQIILCGWATRKHNSAIEMGVAYAQAHGVLVVAAAGDRGDDLSQSLAYPASLSKTYDNVLTVAGVDAKDQLVTVPSKYSNSDPDTVQIAAPGEKILVLQPRTDQAAQTSTGIAAAFVAGASARYIATHRLPGDFPAYLAVKSGVLSESDSIPALQSGVQGGRRLHLQ